jgi:ATP-dependent RNA helicase DDX5/DBP2
LSTAFIAAGERSRGDIYGKFQFVSTVGVAVMRGGRGSGGGGGGKHHHGKPNSHFDKGRGAGGRGAGGRGAGGRGAGGRGAGGKGGKPFKHQKKRKFDSDDSDDEYKKRPKKPVQQKQGMATLKPIDFTASPPFEKCFWPSPLSDEPPSDELKEHRKSLGVLVKGNLRMCPPPVMDVNDDTLPREFSELFAHRDIQRPTPVQGQCWPVILAGGNLLSIAQTGSGKTFAYCLPMIPHIHGNKLSNLPGNRRISPNILVIVPTRELAIQVCSDIKPFKKLFGVRSLPLYGGQDRDSQIDGLLQEGGPHVVVATPGRLIDLLSTKSISLHSVSYLVLDEADRMLAMGFYEQIEQISTQIRPDRQILLFSATFPGKLRDVAEKWVPNAVTVRCNTMSMQQEYVNGKKDTGNESTKAKEGANESKVDSVVPKANEQVDASTSIQAEPSSRGDESGDMTGDAVDAETKAVQSELTLTISPTVKQLVHVCAAHKKPRLLMKYLTDTRAREKESKLRQPGPMLIFCTKIKTLKFLFDFLKRHNMSTGVDCLHGQLPQAQRESVLANFRAGKMSTLIATDVAARGLHIKRLFYVVNYDFPGNLEQYCHRVGRAGRQGNAGESYSLFTRNLAPLAKNLIQLMRMCQQEPEPNLLSLAAESIELADDGDDDGDGAGSGEAGDDDDDDDNDYDDDDDDEELDMGEELEYDLA